MNNNWIFPDPPNVTVTAVKRIAINVGWIGYLEQNRGKPITDEAAVVSVKNIVELDPSILDLAGLPLGWHAWRTAKQAPWSKAQKG